MHFGFDDDQLAFRAAVRDLLADVCPPAAVRGDVVGSGPGFDPKVWVRLGEMGVLGAVAPVAVGGLGLNEVDLVLMLEESGRAALPGPVVEHAAVAVPLLAAAGETTLAAAAARGDATVTFADRPERVGWPDVDALILLDGPAVRLIPASAVTSVERLDCVDRSRRDGVVHWSGGDVLGGADAALALDRAALGTAAQLCGLSAAMIEMTVEYAKQRNQFGVPIGSYQAIKHHLANALLRLEHARPAVYRAAYSVSLGAPTRARDVSMAKVMAGDAAELAGRVALQCHGAIGYTWESDLHLWLKRTWVLNRAWGDRAMHRARLADVILGQSKTSTPRMLSPSRRS